MLNFYTVIVWEVVSLMTLLIIMANTNDLLSKRKQRQFLLLSVSVILGILAEWSGSVAALSGGRLRQIHVWTKMLELSITPVVPFLCADVLRRSADISSKHKWLYSILILHTGLELMSAFGGFIYYVDGNGVFCHGPYYWIYLMTYLGVSVYVLWVGYRVSRENQNRNRIVLVLMLAFLLFGIAANQADKSVKSAWLTVALVVTLIYIFYNDMLQRIDEKTMLLNRASYRNEMSRLRKPVLLEMLDVDFFKATNDEYGHAYGDQCLRVIGNVIRKVFGRYGKCYRVDSDEFCMILNLDEIAIEGLNEQFLAAMEEYRETDPHLPHVSLGHVRYEPSHEKVQDAEQAAISIMYRNKERNKIKYGPIPNPAFQERELSAAHTQAENQEPAAAALDTSGLTGRTFTAFSLTSERSYIYLCNMSTGVSRWSPAAVQYFDLPGEYMFEAGKVWEARIHPQDRQMYHESIEEVFAGRALVHELEYRARNRLGEYVVCTCKGVVLKGNGTDPDLFAGTIVNHGIVDEVDPVTNLHTNAEFTKSIHRLIEERTAACVVKVGIEHFRHINAMYGQEGGNQVLRLFGIELQELVAGKGRVFRLEGAKFAFYLYDATQDEVRRFFRQLRNVAENNIQINNLRIPLRIYGGAVRLDSRHSYDECLVRSSLIYAMEQSLESYRNELVFSEDIRQTMNDENIQLHAEIHRSAMECCRNFFLCYQPILSFSTGKIIGAEALLRWKQEPYGVVPPDSFIPWLENDPAFIPVGNWILRQAIQETEPLRQADPHFILNVNIADTQLEYSDFREDVLSILADTGCPPENLCLELTERCRHMDPDFLADELKFFRSRGITIAIDDFGTGASSMMLLFQLPVNELKLDRSFLLSALTSKQNLAIMESILQNAQKVGFRTCIEGIETREQHELIASLGGDYYQGYYASKPLPIESFLAFYRKK